MTKVLIVIPAYNEANTVGGVIGEIRGVLADRPDLATEILVVDDASTDETRKRSLDAAVPVVSLPVNLGIGGAMQTGYRFARDHEFDIAVQIDGDGQHDAADILKLIDTLQERGLDMVIGSRFVEGAPHYKPSFARKLGMLFSQALLYMGTGKRVFDTTSGFRAVNRPLIELFARNYPQSFAGVVPLVLASRKGYRFLEIPASFKYRAHGASSINFFKSAFYPIQISLAIIGVLIRR